MFDQIAPGYDRFNAWASLGLHHRWRRALVRAIPAGATVLDLATGTGDVAFLAANRGNVVTGLDFSERMLERARSKDRKGAIRWMHGSADRMPFADGSFDCVTSAFALRNFGTGLDAVFGETFRVLKKGGIALHLDFGRPASRLWRLAHHLHLSRGIPFIGHLVCGSAWPDDYLESTIEAFSEPDQVERRMLEAGFDEASHMALTGGVVQLYRATKC